MKIPDKKDLVVKSSKTLSEIIDMVDQLPILSLEELSKEPSAFIMVDMVNGFVREGALKSDRVEGIIPEIVKLSEKCGEYGMKKLAFGDYHTPESPEFNSYPPHCLVNSNESNVVDEISELGGYELIHKNSTNGFLEVGFQKWLTMNENIATFIITGNCTDICIQQFAITLKTWFNMKNRNSRIIVPIDGVETYDLGTHNGDMMNIVALYNMISNGVEIVKTIEL